MKNNLILRNPLKTIAVLAVFFFLIFLGGREIMWYVEKQNLSDEIEIVSITPAMEGRDLKSFIEILCRRIKQLPTKYQNDFVVKLKDTILKSKFNELTFSDRRHSLTKFCRISDSFSEACKSLMTQKELWVFRLDVFHRIYGEYEKAKRGEFVELKTIQNGWRMPQESYANGAKNDLKNSIRFQFKSNAFSEYYYSLTKTEQEEINQLFENIMGSHVEIKKPEQPKTPTPYENILNQVNSELRTGQTVKIRLIRKLILMTPQYIGSGGSVWQHIKTTINAIATQPKAERDKLIVELKQAISSIQINGTTYQKQLDSVHIYKNTVNLFVESVLPLVSEQEDLWRFQFTPLLRMRQVFMSFSKRKKMSPGNQFSIRMAVDLLFFRSGFREYYKKLGKEEQDNWRKKIESIADTKYDPVTLQEIFLPK